jgi:serine/threonine-protein kinase ULK/ATG1
VYLAAYSDNEFAIKRIKLEHSDEIKSAEREIDLFKILKEEDKHLVKLVEGFPDGHYYFLVMEYCSGGDISNLLRQKGKLSSKVLNILAMFYFHFSDFLSRKF